MKTIKCKNQYLDAGGAEVQCNRILAVLTDLQVDMLKIDTEKPIFRCPSCAADQRWTSIYWNGKDFVFETISNHPDIKEEMEYGTLEVCKQVG
jgi:hypothetical protein